MPTMLQLKIKDYLETNHLSMKGMERKAGVAVNTVRNIISGQSKRPTSETLHALANILGCSVYELLQDTDESPEITQAKQTQTPIQKMIRYYLDSHGMSTPKLEKKAGLGLHSVTNILSGQSRMPTSRTLQALATAMGITVEDLLKGNIQAFQGSSMESLAPVLTGAEYPEILSETLAHILHTIRQHKYQFSLHQTLQMLEEIYSYLIQKKPPQVDFVFIEWFVKRAAG